MYMLSLIADPPRFSISYTEKCVTLKKQGTCSGTPQSYNNIIVLYTYMYIANFKPDSGL